MTDPLFPRKSRLQVAMSLEFVQSAGYMSIREVLNHIAVRRYEEASILGYVHYLCHFRELYLLRYAIHTRIASYYDHRNRDGEPNTQAARLAVRGWRKKYPRLFNFMKSPRDRKEI